MWKAEEKGESYQQKADSPWKKPMTSATFFKNFVCACTAEIIAMKFMKQTNRFTKKTTEKEIYGHQMAGTGRKRKKRSILFFIQKAN